ncbi:MAG: hypothetical protein FJ026_17435 [Chloroflexi bacterium]|nr:hypothetical protein [Chloroflexota bacterium]
MSVPWLPKEQVPQRVYDCISRAQTAGVQATTTLAGASRTSLRWVEQVVRAAAAAGAAVISMADSNGCAVPEAVDYLIRFVRDAVGPVPALGFHGHNTFGLATANALAAVRAGADVVDTVPLGLGEGSGITPLEELAFALEVLYGIPTGLDMSLIPCLCAHVQEVFRVEVPPTKTFLGSGLYRHSIDSHIASILRGKWYSWECVNPSLLTRRRELEFGFSKIRRGRTGAIAAKIELMGLEADDQQLDQIIAEVRAIAQEHDWATEAEVETIIGDCLRGVGAKNE